MSSPGESSHVVRRAHVPSRRIKNRGLVLVVLGCGLVARLFDALPHPNVGYVPFVLALYLLPAWYVSGRYRDPWDRHPGPLLAGQAVLTYVPFAVFGTHWVGGVSGLLAGLVLSVLPGRVAWIAYGVLAGLEVTMWSMVGLPYEPVASSTTWLLVAFVNTSLIVFGLSRLAGVVDSLEANRDALAEAEVTRQRLAASRHLRHTVQQRLERVGRLLEACLEKTSPQERRDLVSEAGREARDAASDARRLALDLPDAAQTASAIDHPEVVAPRLARRIATAILVVFTVQYLVNICVPGDDERAPWPVVVLAVLVAAVILALQVRHSTSSRDRRPAGWPWTLTLLAALCFVFYPTAGSGSLLPLTFLAASGLLLIRHWSKWLLLGAVVVAVPVLTLVDPSWEQVSLLHKVTWALYASATVAAASLLLFGLARLAQTASELGEVRNRIAEAARVQERLRLARDAHDMLGLGLSTIALKTDLAAALVHQDPARSRQEAVQALHVTRLVATDVEAVSGDRVTISLTTEVATARRSLAAAGVHTDIDVDPSDEVDVLAAVLREAVTNVLRHSRATRCRIRLERTADAGTLTVCNDGVMEPIAGEPGRGLVNMSERLHAVRGSLNTRIDGSEFTLTAVVPAEVSALSGDPVPALQR